MPCSCDYLDPNEDERNKQIVSSHICYINKKLGLSTPKIIKEASKDSYGGKVDLNTIVIELCSKLQNLTEDQLNDIVYNGRIKEARELADWWDEHKKADLKRLKKNLKKIALDKLTPYEKQLLGL